MFHEDLCCLSASVVCGFSGRLEARPEHRPGMVFTSCTCQRSSSFRSLPVVPVTLLASASLAEVSSRSVARLPSMRCRGVTGGAWLPMEFHSVNTPGSPWCPPRGANARAAPPPCHNGPRLARAPGCQLGLGCRSGWLGGRELQARGGPWGGKAAGMIRWPAHRAAAARAGRH